MEELKGDEGSKPPGRLPSVLLGAATGLVVGIVWGGGIRPLYGRPPSLKLSFILYAVGFTATGATVGATRCSPEVAGFWSGAGVMTVLAVIAGRPTTWILIWVIVFGGSGALWGPAIGLLFRYFSRYLPFE